MVRFFFRRGSSGQSHGAQAPAEDTFDDVPLRVGVRPYFLTEQDSLLYHALVAALTADAVVMPKARLADFLQLDQASTQLKHAIRMDRKWVDFLLCDPFSMQPLAVIERVDTEANDAKKAGQLRDPFVAEALKQAGIVMLRIKTRESYPSNQLRKLILPKISSSTNSPEIDLAQRETKIDSGLTEMVIVESSSTKSAPNTDDSRVAHSLGSSKPLIVSGRIVSV